MAIETESLLAFEDETGLDLDFLGSLLWFTIAEGRVALEDIENAIEEGGLEDKYIPSLRCKRDAFRLASKTGEARGIEFGKKRVNLLVRDVKTAGNTLVRNLVREIVDAKNVRLKLVPVVRLELTEEERLTTSDLIEDLLPEERASVERMQDEFALSCVYFNAYTVRAIVQAVLSTCSPVSVRPSGGVYFIPEKYKETVEGLKTFISVLNKSSLHNSIFSVPVVNASEQRELIQESLEEQVTKEEIDLLAEVRRVVESGEKVTALKAKQYLQRAEKLSELVGEYEDILKYRATSARYNLDLAQKGIVKMLANAGAI